MVNRDETQFEQFTERIFKETYGISSRALYFETNYELRDKIREAVIALRISYDESLCTTPYNEDEIRKAYMIAYYPYYFYPAYQAMQKILEHVNLGENPHILYLAGGPCPELYGTARALSEKNFNGQLTGIIFDAEAGWKDQQTLTFKLCKEMGVNTNFYFSTSYNIFDINSVNFMPEHDCTHCQDQLECGRAFGNILYNYTPTEYGGVDIIFIQNYLSHVQDIEEFKGYVGMLFASLLSGQILCFLDLDYDSTSQIFDLICDEDFLAENELSVIEKTIPSESFPCEVDHGLSTFGIRTNIFGYKVENEPLKNYLNNSAHFENYLKGTEIFTEYETVKKAATNISLVDYIEAAKGKEINGYLKNPKRFTRYYYVILQKI